ncbi:MAG: hypothetical protein COZ06_29875 [Armatimonadetes bacterium CG_4_10_14_3_um_filter_66_18]|nr:hypothetical protein [Armatimonadota bacterium]OIO95437.1 MAG: hypothetical protein AUJ96_26670 [Armatimonadetes bacterium CG2_30_66_41]PIX47372.1 MAG: hypothetical protein COZ57_08650 [Armatimonadetes bacterium CG_4_8_14_3_um_filter_66_20]PIY39240.1 MAG: hypothetical protein COZ06_29875 [Armatimonadetes bacterium CG_4_10_14_3_um_filter_66_18]PIZ49064.1 MAG: hypothetical protein COY42_04895 [Armatimonadetes bacterium CG_4_10_14_0_8_um_filter_66_14]PJB60649.1 MAG: hypothetical protein CO096_
MSNAQTQAQMHEESVLGHLEELARKLDVSIREGKYDGKGGMARWRDNWVLLVDRAMPTDARVSLYLDELQKLNMEHVFVLPAIRELFEKRRQRRGRAPASR